MGVKNKGWFKKGYTPWLKGRKHRPKSILKMKEVHKNTRPSPKTEFKKGNIPWNKGLRGAMPIPWNKGKKGVHFSPKTEFKKGKPSWNKGKHPDYVQGRNHPAWKGGKSFEPYSLNWTNTLRRSIRERDKYICQICSLPQGDIAFDIHHIDYDKKNCNPNNLITLCRNCHTKTNFDRKHWKRYFIKKIIL